MEVRSRKFPFPDFGNFLVTVHGNFGGLHHDDPDIRLYIDGLEHPLAKDSRYFGEETKNPQHKEATDIISRVFDEWAATLPENLAFHIKVNPVQNNSPDQKFGWVSSKSGIPDSAKEILFEQLDRLERMVEEKQPEIRQALERGKSIVLTDPNPAIETAFAAAFVKVSTHPGLYLGPSGKHSSLGGQLGGRQPPSGEPPDEESGPSSPRLN